MRGTPTVVFSVVFLGAALLAVPPPLLAQTATGNPDDQLIGTWRLDLSKSRYMPGPPPKTETRVFSRGDQGVNGIVRRTTANGREEIIEYRADFDQEYPVSGTEAYDAVRFTRIDSRTSEATLSHAGRIYGVARRVISRDGETMTITFRQESAAVIYNVAVYNKDHPER